MEFTNVYQDATRAASYAKLEFPATYYLAYRDIPRIIQAHVTGKKALDFGCGTGRSSRFLKKLGFAATGIDIAPDMIEKARGIDPEGDYRLIADGDFHELPDGGFDLVLAVFTFDNIPDPRHKARLLAGLSAKLAPAARIVMVVSAPEIYLYEWASFSTRDFPENRAAKSGDIVRIVMTDVEDGRPVEDILCTDADYREVFEKAALRVVQTARPLGREEEPFAWVNETRISPWCIYVLALAG